MCLKFEFKKDATNSIIDRSFPSFSILFSLFFSLSLSRLSLSICGCGGELFGERKANSYKWIRFFLFVFSSLHILYARCVQQLQNGKVERAHVVKYKGFSKWYSFNRNQTSYEINVYTFRQFFVHYLRYLMLLKTHFSFRLKQCAKSPQMQRPSSKRFRMKQFTAI